MASPPAAAAPPAASDAIDRETWIVAGVVMLGAIMSILDTTVINVAIDRLASDFSSSLTTIQWVVTGYTLALAAVIPVTGWASDRFGTKRIYLWSLALFVGGSVLSGLAWSAGSLIGFRVLQGIGGGMIMPAVMTIMTKKAGPHRMGRVMGALGVPMLIAPIAGPVLGGWLVDDVSWRWIFFINLPIGIIAFVLALRVLERDEPQPAHRMDWLGLLLLSPGLTLAIFGLAESASDGFGATKSWLPTAAGALLVATFLWHSWRSENPLIDIRLFTHSRAGAAAGTFMLFSIAFFGSLLLVPLYYQSVRGDTALQAGLLLVPQGLGSMLTMPIAGRLTDRFGPGRFAAVGIPLIVVGLSPFAFVDADTSYWLLGGFSFVLGLGMGMSMMPTMTAAMQAVPPQAIARTSTAMNIIRQSGASIGTAILSVILASNIKDQLGGAAGGGGGFDAVHGMSEAQRTAVAQPLADAFSSTFVWALILLALAFLPALAMALWRDKPAEQDAGEPGAGVPLVME
ncbi:DHA2 family efflux MFS transporter permease subunit [Patulibacter sp. SYSU D01012]|uniref:DHA2 family efflux MFS transporter permease subunit n=1 Tax=Patulibacter sp. SYSU D01012 TaxID=2817381 RepID=UPI001B3069DD|nr:DHA2 family efflux MFS transporter permease subunit [Patulibacter sp. SYSU D01012]